jgi:organic radical activating enzyme
MIPISMKTASVIHCTYPVVETFHSVQGEGFWTGTSAFFIRLGGCDVYCPWCDQKETWNAARYPHHPAGELAEIAREANPAIVIITGGEPLLHDLNPLTRELRQKGLKVHLETSGAPPFTGAFDWVTFSPKLYKEPHPSIYRRVNELKVVIADEGDLRWAEEQAAKVPPEAVKFLQPEWNTPESREFVFDYIRQHPDWRLSLQTHKFLGVR